MSKIGTTIYQRARKESPYTQEQAAERLYVSVKTVKAWEQGQRVPDNEAVARMAELYGTPWLSLEHSLAESGALGVLPQVTLQGLPSAVLTLVNRCLALSDDYRRLMAIAEDGLVDAQERPEYDRIAGRVRDVVAAGLQVLYAEGTDPGVKKEHPDAGTSRRSVDQAGWGHQGKISGKYYTPPRRDHASPVFCKGGGAL